MMVQDPFYFDFSKQPDNEIWYTTFDNKKLENNSGKSDDLYFKGINYYTEGLQFIKHTYENGIGKIIYNKPITKLGETAIQLPIFGKQIKLNVISFPKQFQFISAYCFNWYDDYAKTHITAIFQVKNTSIILGQLSLVPYKIYVQPNVNVNIYSTHYNTTIVQRRM